MRTTATARRYSNIQHHAFQSAMFVTLLSIAVLAVPARAETSAPVNLEWDPVTDGRVDHYQLHYGRASGQYDEQIRTNATSIEVAGLDAGANYFFAARACDSTETECSAFSNELQTRVPHAAPDAGLVASQVSGVAPLTVTFSDQSQGTISERRWDFGDGGTSTAATAVHSYSQPGVYSVTLRVTGPGGTDSTVESDLIVVEAPLPASNDSMSSNDAETGAMTEPDTANDGPLAEIPIEFGTVEIDHGWQRVDFQKPFSDPIVVAKSMSARGGDPTLIRIDAIDADGFWIRVQEWDSLDDRHIPESASYLVMERGRHQLPDGAWVEAGSLETSATNQFVDHAFSASFATIPVVFAAVTTVTEEDAVIARLKAIDRQGFKVGLREQEANAQVHLAERVDYIAWEASLGTIGQLSYAVGRTGNQVSSKSYRFNFPAAFDQPPALLADMQTTNGGDTASLRWTNLNGHQVDLRVQEEQSKDAEIDHANEDIGYFIAAVAE